MERTDAAVDLVDTAVFPSGTADGGTAGRLIGGRPRAVPTVRGVAGTDLGGPVHSGPVHGGSVQVDVDRDDHDDHDDVDHDGPADPRLAPAPPAGRSVDDDEPAAPRSVSVFAGPDADMIDLGLGDVFGEPPEWQERALCAQTDPEAFFPEKGGSTREAKRICLGCEVRAECLEYALANDERFGIWGGMSERERRRYRRRVG